MIYKKVARFCHQKLLENKDALKYLENRGFNDNTIKKFEIGLFPQDLRELFNIVNAVDLRNADIISNASSSKFKTQDLIFPIKNVYGEYIAIAGRVRLNEENRGKIPKYMNSIYPKSQHLFGLNYAKKSIMENDIAYVVEGYFDVIAPHQAGMENVVAVCGKYLAIRQLALLSRYTDKIVLLFDNEKEAQLRANKIVEKRQHNGISLTAFNPLENTDVKDLDEFLRKYSIKDLFAVLNEQRRDYANIKVLW